jgi:hypothetical protein
MEAKQCFWNHLSEVEFLLGEARGQWGVAGDPQLPSWPRVIIWIRAPRSATSSEVVYLNFDLAGYPSQAPTALPWNMETNQRLANNQWPKGSTQIATAFNPGWKNGSSLYIPMDRTPMTDHAPWQAKYPQLWWQPHFTIINYLQYVYEILYTAG